MTKKNKEQKQIINLLEEIKKEYKNVLSLNIQDFIGNGYDPLFLFDWNYLFLLAAKSTKKSRVLAFLILILQYFHPDWHAQILRNELKTHKRTTIRAILWMLKNKFEKHLPHFAKQYEYEQSHDRIVRHLPDGNKQFINFQGLEKGIDKVSGADYEYGQNCIIQWSEPSNAEDRFKRGGFDNEKSQYYWSVIKSSGIRGCPNPKIIMDGNEHTPDAWFSIQHREKIPLTKKNINELENKSGAIWHLDKKYHELRDPKSNKLIGYQKALFGRFSYRINEFLKPEEFAEILWRKENTPGDYEVLDLGIPTKNDRGIFTDLINVFEIYNSNEISREEFENKYLNKITFFNQGLDFGLTDATCNILIGVSEKKELFFLKADFWEGQKFDTQNSETGHKKVAREKQIAINVIEKTYENKTIFFPDKKEQVAICIDYQNHSFLGMLQDSKNNLEKSANMNLSWMELRLASEKFGEFNKVEVRWQVLRFIFSKVPIFIDSNFSKIILETLKVYKGDIHAKTKWQDVIDALWYALVPFVYFLLSPEDIEKIIN